MVYSVRHLVDLSTVAPRGLIEVYYRKRPTALEEKHIEIKKHETV